MNTLTQIKAKASSVPLASHTPVPTGLLQRTQACSCAAGPIAEHDMEHDMGLARRRKPLKHNYGKVRIRGDVSSSLQPKLAISQPGDKYEQEADQVAEQVMRMPEPRLQRQAAPEEEEEEERLQTKPLVQRQAEWKGEEEDEELLQTKPLLQRRVDDGIEIPSETPAIIHGVLHSPGQPLDPATRAFMEPRFGHDFSQVRVHTDAKAAESARAVNALAYTVGHDIAFGKEQYAPGTQAGQRLLAHELTHVIQQHRMGLCIQRANQLSPQLPSGCVATTMGDGVLTSSESFEVSYIADKDDIGRASIVEITLRQRDEGDKILDTRRLERPKEGTIPEEGKVTIPAGIPIANENHYYELAMGIFNENGVLYGGLGKDRPTIRFAVCQLAQAPTGGWPLLFAQAIYAEGEDAGEFPYIRDLVYNRIDWVRGPCPGDHVDFGYDIPSVLNAPNQFESVLMPTEKFVALKTALNSQSGPCHFTTPPRSKADDPAICRLINAAIQTQAAGDGNTHDYVFFRSDMKLPSDRAVDQWHYPKGNYYWKISGCPEDRKIIHGPVPWHIPWDVREPPG